MGTVTQNIRDYISNLFSSSAYRPASVALELILIGIVVYAVLRFLHGTRGARLLQGLLSLLVVGLLVLRVLADQADLERIKQLYQPLVWTVFLTTLIVFQPELRRGLMRIGETSWRRGRAPDIDRLARPIATACAQLSKNKIGALIAIERDIGLGGLTDDGIRLDARLSVELLNTIFWPGSALHDLGVVIQHGRITAAGCQFPMADAEGLDPSIGSRHRAAVGLSLDSDAVVVVVSEETGAISIAVRGQLHRRIPPDALLGTLRHHLGHDTPPPKEHQPWLNLTGNQAQSAPTLLAGAVGDDPQETHGQQAAANQSEQPHKQPEAASL
jgi:diadenylate cyclase